jgi:putative spermidine/putrescine transport system ATP-binding protein
MHSLRPEKITLHQADAAGSAGGTTASGTIAEVIYLGTSVRLLVLLDDGYRLNVLEQNVSGTSDTDRRGTPVEARWSPSDVVPLAPTA